MVAGSILADPHASFHRLFTFGIVVHGALSLFWAHVLYIVLPRKRPMVLWGAIAGVAIAALDISLIGRFFPLISALPFWPQLLDHVAFGVVVAVVLAWRTKRRAKA